MGIRNLKVRGFFSSLLFILANKKKRCSIVTAVFPQQLILLGVLKIQAEVILKVWESWDTKLCYVINHLSFLNDID